MKIVCDNCATKYSIADEKVRGKVFKIRCKKCSHIIVVKGTEGGDAPLDAGAADASEAAPTADAGSDGWHVVINGEQVGPLSPADVRAKFSAGEIDAETFAWKEGFGDWQRLASIDDFSDLAAAAAPPPSDATRRTGTDDLFGGGGEAQLSAPGGDLFGSSSSGAGGDLFSGGGSTLPAPSSGGAGLFAQPSAEPASSPKRAPTPGFGAQAMRSGEAAPPGDGGKGLTGARNENSVLFSLNNLQALASGGGPAKQATNQAGGVDNRPGYANAQTEGSGLIDIRAMAAATLSSNPSPMDNRSSNDLPQFASAPVFSPIAAPILMPSAPSGAPGWVWPVIGLGVVTLLSIVGLGVYMINKSNNMVAANQAMNQANAANLGNNLAASPAGNNPATAAVGTAPVAGTPAPGTTPAAVAPVAVAAAEKTTDKGADRASPDKHAGKKDAKAAKAEVKGAASASGTKSTKADSPVAAEAPPPPAAKKGKKDDDIDALLNGATSGDKPSRATREDRAPAGGGGDDNLPEQLDRGAIVGGMGKIKGKVGACYEQYKVPGMAPVSVTIAKNGHVSNAAVGGAFAGTPTADCVSKAVKGATFPPFKGASQTINYPFMLR